MFYVVSFPNQSELRSEAGEQSATAKAKQRHIVLISKWNQVTAARLGGIHRRLAMTDPIAKVSSSAMEL